MSSAVVPRVNRLLYASHAFGSSVLSRATQAWLIFFYAPPADEDRETIVPRLALTTILLLLGFLDAIDDPLIGHWSDRTRTRWGRRIPFIVLATPFYVLFFFLFWVPPMDPLWLAAAYFTVIVFVQRVSGTLSGGPMEALLPEVARTPSERVSNVAWQFIFGALGAGVGLVATGVINDYWGFAAMGAIVAVIALASRYIGLFGVWRYVRGDAAAVSTQGIVPSLRAAFRNDQFLYFLPTFVFFNTAIMLLTAALPFYADAVILGDRDTLDVNVFGWSLELGEGSVSALLFGTALLAAVISVPLVYWLALRFGKARVYSLAMLAGVALFPLLFLMGLVPGVPVLAQSLVFVAAAGLPMVGVFTFPNAILADVIDYDWVRTGMRREGLYYGAQNVVEKWTGSLSFPLFGLLLLFGETADDPLGIRLMGPAAGVLALLGYVAFRGYWLPDSVTKEAIAKREDLKASPLERWL